MRTQAYLLSAIVLILAMISISLLTVPVYLETYIQPDDDYLINNQRNVIYQIFTILDGLISIVSHNDAIFEDYIRRNRVKLLDSNDFYDGILLVDQNIFNDITRYFNTRIKGQFNVIKDFFGKELVRQNIKIARDCTYIYTSSKLSNKSNVFVNVIAAGLGYSVCKDDDTFRYQVVHKINIENLHIISGPISLEDTYISVDFVINNSYIINNKVVLDFKSILYRDTIVEIYVSNKIEVYRDYIVSFDPSMNRINVKIAVPMLEVFDHRGIEFRIKVIVNNDLMMRLVIFVLKKQS